MTSKRILIVEDEKQIARFLELELQHEGYIVDIRYNGIEGLKEVEENQPDLVLLDIMLPGIRGMEVCRKIRRFSEIPIIFLTARDETVNKIMGLDLGANDYVTKPFVIEELLARIRAALRKHEMEITPANHLMISDLAMDISKHLVSRGTQMIILTKREYDLLEYFMKNREIVLTRLQILENVWGFDYMGDTNVVDVYVRYLRTKIDDGYNTKFIHTIRGVGYVMKEKISED